MKTNLPNDSNLDHPISHEDNDDTPVGRILSRREVLALLGAAGSALLVGAGFQAAAADTSFLPLVMHSGATPTLAPTEPATTPTATTTPAPACIVSPALTEGPYFVDEQLNRSDIRLDPSDGSTREGVSLQLTLRVYTVNSAGCTP